MSPELVHALRLLGASERTAPSDSHDEIESFSNIAAETACAAYFDWKVTNFGVLDGLRARFDREIPLDVSMQGEDCIIVVEDERGEERIERCEKVESMTRDDAVGRFLTLLPPPRVALKLVFFERTDCDVYLVLDEQSAAEVLSALGSRAPEVVQRVRTDPV